jgi:outer membrane protein
MNMRIICLLAALGICVLSHAQSPSQGKVAYASVEYIISQLPDTKQIEAELKSTQTQLRNQIQARSQEVQKEYADFNANARAMADTVRANRQKKLEQAIADLESMQQDANTTLQNKQKLLMAPLYLKVNKAIQEVAVENGYEIVLTDKIGGMDFLLYSSTQVDISKLVLQKFGVKPE